MKMTLKEIDAAVASYVAAAKQAGAWSASTNNLAGLLDKIAKTITIDGLFEDKLPELDGEELPLGKTIEEYYQDLCAITDWEAISSNDSDPAGAALKPYYPEYEDASYNYTLGKRIIPTTIKYDEYERAFNSEAEYVVCVNMILKRLYDTFAMFKYDAKKQVLANLIAKVVACQADSGATSLVPGTTDIVKGTRYVFTDSDSAKHYAIAKKAHTHDAADTFASLVAAGILVEYRMINELAKPVDTATGEAFVEQVKKDVEEAQYATEGFSLNGNSVGAAEGLLLVVLKGIKPVLDVQVEAGAFNPEKLALPAEIKVVDKFGNDANDVYAILIDRRIARLHPSYMSVKEQLNGAGDFVNYFLHTENTAFIGKNCFVKVYKNVSE